MKSEQIKHSLSVGIKSIQSRVFDRETDEVISFVKIPIKDSGLVRCEKGTREMNNEPVAWAIKADNDFTEIGFDNALLEEIEQMYVMEGWKYEVIPLYTHPVKELTDEEIKSCWNWETDCQEWAIEFARAILRKAQEK